MALEKKISYNQQIYHPSVVHVQERTAILEDGKEISFSFQRWTISAVDDYSDQDPQTKAVCDAVFTDKVKADYQKHLDENVEQYKDK